MNILIKDCLDEDITIVAYRVCNLVSEREERVTDNIFERMGDMLELGVKNAREINKPFKVDYIEFTYVELISDKGKVIYVYDDLKSYDKYKDIYACKDLNVFKDEMDWFTREPRQDKKNYPVKQLINELEGIVYRLKDGVYKIFEVKKLGIAKKLVDNTEIYEKGEDGQFIVKVNELIKKVEYEDIDAIIDYWKEIILNIKSNQKMTNDLRAGFYEIRKEYEKAMEMIEGKRKQLSQQEIREYGKKGEENVDYAIKWLPKEFYSIEKDIIATDRTGIWIKDTRITDEKQEFDHIVVGPQGVFLIETKNYTGKLTIDVNGNWIREKNGETEGVANPIQQVDRHYMIMQSVLEGLVDKNDIINIVCMANSKIIIEGIENSSLNLVKVDMLNRYIKDYNNGIEKYNEGKRGEIAEKIKEFRC